MTGQVDKAGLVPAVTVVEFELVWCEAPQAGVTPVGVVAGEPLEDGCDGGCDVRS